MNPVDDTDREKRITFQLHDYWVGLTNDRDLPTLRSLNPEDIAPYKENMVLIDLRDPEKEPTLQVIGTLLQKDLDQDLTLKGISEIPPDSLISRITEHYLEVILSKSPISFDTEVENRHHEKALFRGILMPFSDDGDTINFLLGAVRWIENEDYTDTAIADDTGIENDYGIEDDLVSDNLLQSQLEQCRKLVQGQNPADSRSRKSLYEALGAILDFHDSCQANPDQYRDILQDEGLKTQSRAPFTPCLKLCFGRDYDKTRLTEYAAALSFARKNKQDGESLPGFLDQFPGGIKGCVRAERAERNQASGGSPKHKTGKNTLEESQKIIDEMPAIAVFDTGEGYEEKGEGYEENDDLCLILGRRDGSQIEVIKILNEDEKVLGPILKRVALDY